MTQPSNSNPQPSNSSPYVYQQIEATAGLYTPAIYDLLTYYSALSLQPDEFDGQFIPITDVRPQSAQQTLIFVVGILPPSSNVTGNVLDRSATVQATTFNPTQNININPQSAQVNNPRLATTSQGGNTIYGVNGQVANGIPGSDRGPPIAVQMSVTQIATALRDAYVNQFHTQPSQAALAILTAQTLRENSGIWPNNNPGMIGSYNTSGGYTPPPGQATFAYVQGTNPDGSQSLLLFNTYATPQAGAQSYLNRVLADSNPPGASLQALNNGDVNAYVNAICAGKYTTTPPSVYLAGFANIQTLQNQIGDPAALNSANLPKTSIPITGDAGGTAAWNASGSSSANQAQQQIGQTANTNLNLTGLGQMYLAQQQQMIKDTLAAIQQMQNTPPLRMLVNPQSFKLSADKIIADGNWGRNGPIVEHWGDAQDKLECGGKVAAFYSLDATGASSYQGAPGVSPGLTRNARQYSTAYQNFLSLFLLYKNNGGLWLSEFINTGSSKPPSRPNNLSVVGSIYIFYDNILYIGSFDSFNLTETETVPFSLEYNFSFTIRATFLLDNGSQQMSYGAPTSMTTGQAPANPVATNPNMAPTQAPINQAT